MVPLGAQIRDAASAGSTRPTKARCTVGQDSPAHPAAAETDAPTCSTRAAPCSRSRSLTRARACPHASVNVARAQNHTDYVLVHKVDRLARNRVDDVEITMAIKKAGAPLVSATENIDEKSIRHAAACPRSRNSTPAT